MHDPLAVAVALDPTLVETRRAAVDVETAGRLTLGATIVDWRGQWGRLANTEVAVAADAERFRTMFFEAMVRLAETGGRGSWSPVYLFTVAHGWLRTGTHIRGRHQEKTPHQIKRPCPRIDKSPAAQVKARRRAERYLGEIRVPVRRRRRASSA